MSSYTAFPIFTSSRDRWDLTLNLVDIEFSRPLTLCESLYLRPHIGIKIVNVEEDLRTKFTGEYDFPGEDGEIIFPLYGHTKEKHCFTGAGPRIGVNLQWDFFCGFGIYGNVATGVACGDREAKRHTFVDRSSGTPTNTDINPFGNIDVKVKLADEYCVLAATDLEAGLAWYTCFCCERYSVRLKMGWDHHYIFDVMGDHGVKLSTSGLVFGASTHF